MINDRVLRARESVPEEPYAWVGAVSFEERCLRGADILCGGSNPPVKGFIVDYGTVVRPVRSAEERRARQRRALLRSFHSRSLATRPVTLFPYRMSSATTFFERVAAECAADGLTALVVDCSCITKLHAVAFADWLIERGPEFDLRVMIQSTVPRQYGWQYSQQLTRGGYRDVVFAPVGPMRVVSLRQELTAEVDVIALLGHEGLRLTLGLSVVDVASGLAVVSRSTTVADAELIAEMENAKFIEDAKQGRIGQWDVATMNLETLGELDNRIRKFIEAAACDRVVVMPFGPKPAIIQATMSALGADRSAVWVSYPVPQAYSIDYSVGVGPTRLLEVVNRAVDGASGGSVG